MIKTGFALYKSGYITEDGKDVFAECLIEAKTKEWLIAWAKKKKLDVDEHYILEVGYEIIEGIKVPDTGDDYDYLHNYINRS
jgi:hypothetical protein